MTESTLQQLYAASWLQQFAMIHERTLEQTLDFVAGTLRGVRL